MSLKDVKTSIPAKQREQLPGFAQSGGVKAQMRVDCPDYEQGLIDALQRVEAAQKAAQGPSKAVLEMQAADRRAQRKREAAEKKAQRATSPRSNGSVSPQSNDSVSPVKETTSNPLFNSAPSSVDTGAGAGFLAMRGLTPQLQAERADMQTAILRSTAEIGRKPLAMPADLDSRSAVQASADAKSKLATHGDSADADPPSSARARSRGRGVTIAMAALEDDDLEDMLDTESSSSSASSSEEEDGATEKK